ncbi:MAG: hypothetical protein MIO90_06245 [Methanomassiliicoccales archaeon]|nr:hypothetical protein [Methanomassiliicoccales archaeon]
MKKTLVGLGGALAAIGAGAAYYFHTATYTEVIGHILDHDITRQVPYDPIYVTVSIVVAIIGVAILIYGALAGNKTGH